MKSNMSVESKLAMSHLNNVLTLYYSSNHTCRNVYEKIEDYQVESKCAMVS